MKTFLTKISVDLEFYSNLDLFIFFNKSLEFYEKHRLETRGRNNGSKFTFVALKLFCN